MVLQSWFEHNLDTYTRRARLSPALIVVLPLALAALMFFPNEFTLLGVLVSVLVCCGGTALLAQVGRDMGKTKEERLFAIGMEESPQLGCSDTVQHLIRRY